MRYALAVLALLAAGLLVGADASWESWKCKRQCRDCGHGHGHGLFKGHGLGKGCLHGLGHGLHSGGGAWTDFYPLCRERPAVGPAWHTYNRSPRDFFMADP